GENWAAAGLVPAPDRAAPHAYFLFVGTDNGFLTAAGKIQGPDSTIGPVGYDGFSGYAANRQPANSPDGGVNANDTMFLVYRVTIMYDVAPTAFTGLSR